MELKDRIRGYLPVVIDVETSGFNDKTDALLEICAILLSMDENGSFFPKTTLHYHVKPFDGANIESSAIKFNGIDIDNPFRLAVTEKRHFQKYLSILRLLSKKRAAHGLFWLDIMPFLTLDLSKQQLKGRA
jgi:ribonuclease T